MVLDRSQSRSSKYQSTLLEISYDPVLLFDYSDSKGYGSHLDNEERADELKGLREELAKAMWDLIKKQMTDRQIEVLTLLFHERLTQVEAASKLKLNQSSINKILNGNKDYSVNKNNSIDKNKKSYGGSIKKIRKLIMQDKDIQEILLKIGELQNE